MRCNSTCEWTASGYARGVNDASLRLGASIHTRLPKLGGSLPRGRGGWSIGWALLEASVQFSIKASASLLPLACRQANLCPASASQTLQGGQAPGGTKLSASMTTRASSPSSEPGLALGGSLLRWCQKRGPGAHRLGRRRRLLLQERSSQLASLPRLRTDQRQTVSRMAALRREDSSPIERLLPPLPAAPPKKTSLPPTPIPCPCLPAFPPSRAVFAACSARAADHRNQRRPAKSPLIFLGTDHIEDGGQQ